MIIIIRRQLGDPIRGDQGPQVARLRGSGRGVHGNLPAGDPRCQEGEGGVRD